MGGHPRRRPDPVAAWQARPYPQLLRGPGHRWWRALVGTAVVLAWLAAIVLASLVAFAVIAVLGGSTPDADPAAVLDLSSPSTLLLTNLALAALVPTVQCAVWLGHGWRPRWVSSVAGGLRWGWLLRCAVYSLAVALASTVLLWVLFGRPSGEAETESVVLLAIVLLTTPLQAAGEEYFFRGWVTQAIGSLVARAALGAVVAGAVSALLFALAHGGQDPALFADRFAFGVLASWLTWRTGGLEAAIAAHTVNNIVVFVPVIAFGGLGEALTVTSAPAAVVVLDVVAMVALGLLLTRVASRRAVQRQFVPPPPSGPSGPPRQASGPVVVGPHPLG